MQIARGLEKDNVLSYPYHQNSGGYMTGRQARQSQVTIRLHGLIWLMVWVLWFFPSSLLAQPTATGIFTETINVPAQTEPVNPEIVTRQRPVDVSFERLVNPNAALDRLHLNLFDDVVLTAVQDHLDITPSQDKTNDPLYTWTGYIDGISDSQVTLVFQGQRLSGTIDLSGTIFHIRNTDSGQHVIRELIPNPVLPIDQDSLDLPKAVNHSSPLEREVFNLTNRERRSRGLRALAWNGKLATAARRHARDMADGNFHSHTGSDGSSAGDRITRAGYAWNQGGEWRENIAAWSAPETAEAVVNRWMNSSGHRASILKTTICDLGVGHAGNARSIGSRFDTYWTQNFGRLGSVSSGQCNEEPEEPGDITIDTNFYYRLTNAALGNGRALDTYSDTHEPFMARSRNVTGQHWRLTPLGNNHYRLTNLFLGVNRALDTYSDTHEPFMARSRNVTGQFWKLTPVGNGRFRLTNRFLGSGRSLDTRRASREPFMGNSGNTAGQKWRLEKLSRIR